LLRSVPCQGPSPTPTRIREILAAIRRITGRDVPAVFAPRRAGDPPMLYADSSLARERLGFLPGLSDIDTIIRTAAPSFRIEHRL
jgi:UDP-arabinose 4-epimerase